MTDRIWINNRVPQTLYIAQLLLYIRGVLGLLSLTALGRAELFGSATIAAAVILLASVGAAAAAYGIANSFKWGWRLGVAAACMPFVIRLEWAIDYGIGDALSFQPISLLFDLAVLGLLLHQQSAQHQRIYFR